MLTHINNRPDVTGTIAQKNSLLRLLAFANFPFLPVIDNLFNLHQ